MSNLKEKAQVFALIGVAMLAIPFLLAQFFSHFRKREGQFRDDIWDRMSAPERERKIDEYIVRENLAKLDAHERLELPPPAQQQSKKAEGAAKAPTSSDTQAAPRFQPPNFNGPPHAVLGLPPNPSKEQVLAAFRHWLKRYHPDHVAHLGKRFEEQAKRRASQIIEAKEALLKRISGH